MIKAKAARADRGPMQAFFTTSDVKPNQKETVGVLKFFTGLKPTCHLQLRIGLDCLGYCQRNGVPTTFSQEWSLVKSQADGIMVKTLSRALRADGMDVKTFLHLHAKVLRTLFPSAEFDTVMNHKGDMLLVKDSISKLYCFSDLGHQLFGSIVSRLVNEDVAKIIRTHVEALKTKLITEKVLAAQKSKCLAECNRLPSITSLKANRTVSYTYGVHNTLEREVSSLVDEVSWKFACLWKGFGVASGKIKTFGFEEIVCAKISAPGSGSVDDDLCASTKVARAALVQAVENAKLDNQNDLVAFVTSRSAAWVTTDRDFGVEISILKALGGNVGKRLLSEHMRAAIVHQQPSDSLATFQLLTTKPVYKLADKASQVQFDLMHKIIGRIVDGRAPEIDDCAQKADMLKELLLLLPGYLQHEVAKSGGGTETVTGSKALSAMYDTMKTKVDNGRASMQDVEPFVVYAYLATKEDQQKYKAMVDVVKAKIGAVGGTKRARGSRGSSSDAAAAASSNAAADAAVQSAMAMFS
eukprot:6631504-Pyramimonas_sp.AAC.1